MTSVFPLLVPSKAMFKWQVLTHRTSHEILNTCEIYLIRMTVYIDCNCQRGFQPTFWVWREVLVVWNAEVLCYEVERSVWNTPDLSLRKVNKNFEALRKLMDARLLMKKILTLQLLQTECMSSPRSERLFAMCRPWQVSCKKLNFQRHLKPVDPNRLNCSTGVGDHWCAAPYRLWLNASSAVVCCCVLFLFGEGLTKCRLNSILLTVQRAIDYIYRTAVFTFFCVNNVPNPCPSMFSDIVIVDWPGLSVPQESGQKWALKIPERRDSRKMRFFFVKGRYIWVKSVFVQVCKSPFCLSEFNVLGLLLGSVVLQLLNWGAALDRPVTFHSIAWRYLVNKSVTSFDLIATEKYVMCARVCAHRSMRKSGRVKYWPKCLLLDGVWLLLDVTFGIQPICWQIERAWGKLVSPRNSCAGSGNEFPWCSTFVIPKPLVCMWCARTSAFSSNFVIERMNGRSILMFFMTYEDTFSVFPLWWNGFQHNHQLARVRGANNNSKENRLPSNLKTQHSFFVLRGSLVLCIVNGIKHLQGIPLLLSALIIPREHNDGADSAQIRASPPVVRASDIEGCFLSPRGWVFD